jgi:hypothetical protein
MARIIAACLLLAACTTYRAVEQDGPIVNGQPDQAKQQCEKQPWLAWCHAPD